MFSEILNRKISSLKESNNRNYNELTGTKEETPKIDKEALLKSVEKLKIKITKLSKSTFALRIVLFCYLGFIFLRFYFIVAVNAENVSFRNNIDVISAYVDNSVILSLKSNWARMKNKSDYDNIRLEIEKIKKLKSLD